jgi:acetyl-CoA carboxylase carboxyltransferase component
MFFEKKKPNGILGWVDKHSFNEFQPENETSLIMGKATIAGSPIWIFGNNPKTVESSSRAMITKQADFFDHIETDPLPLIVLMDSGADKDRKEGKTPIPVDAIWLQNSNRGIGYIFYKYARLRSVMPLIAVVLGDVGASQTFPINLCHFSIMLKDLHVSIGRADVVKSFTGKEVDMEQLSGSLMHSTTSGVNDMLVEDEEEALSTVTRLLKYLPSGINKPLPVSKAMAPEKTIAIDQIVPKEVKRAFDMNLLIEAIADKHSIFPVKSLFATEVITAFALFEGHPAGIVANNSSVKGAMFFPKTCQKIIRFLDLCDDFGIPVVFLADNPGYMVGVETEQAGSIRYGADLMISIASMKARKMCIVVRRAYTAGLYAMAGAGFNTEHYYAMPTASITIFGKEVLDHLAQMKDQSPTTAALIEEMQEAAQNPEVLAQKGYVDKVLEWSELEKTIVNFVKGS